VNDFIALLDCPLLGRSTSFPLHLAAEPAVGHGFDSSQHSIFILTSKASGLFPLKQV
jgi:hypothetical protein